MKEKERVLSKKEINRKSIIEKRISEKENEGYKKSYLTVGIILANVIAFFITIPLCTPFVALFFILNKNDIRMFSLPSYFIFLIALIAAFVIHELIHGVVWGLSASQGFKSIEFGFMKKYLTPYCTCLEPLTKSQYILGSLMPGIVLGYLPMIISIFTGSILTLFFGILMVMGAGGDILVVWKILRYKTEKMDIIYVDHPTELGLILLER